MTALRSIVNSAGARKALMISAVTLGVAGVLSGAWMVASVGAAGAAGLIGGTAMLGIGWAGLRAINHHP